MLDDKKLKEKILKQLMQEMNDSEAEEKLKPAIKVKQVKEDIIPIEKPEIEEEKEEEELPQIDPNSIEELEARLEYLKKKKEEESEDY